MGAGEQSPEGVSASPDEKFRLRSPQISLPKGGGAIRGLGEKFTANPVTGTGSLTVPIATSPGRSGFGPSLALSYDSAAGNGPFGFGWSLSSAAITRKTDKGLPQYSAAGESDVFILSGAEDLVPVFRQDEDGHWVRDAAGNLLIHDDTRIVDHRTYRVRRFRPRIEAAFARIERWTNTADARDDFWRSISGTNLTTWYGRTPNSRIADPADPTRIFSWLICESHDDRGNVAVYGYRGEDSTRIFEDAAGLPVAKAHERNRTDASRSAQRYLKRVRYGNRVPYFPGLSAAVAWPEPPDAHARDGADSWHFEVVLDYGDHDRDAPEPADDSATNPQGAQRYPWPARPDPFSSYRSSFEVRTYRLCRRVLMFHHFPDAPEVNRNCLVRSTDFVYAADVDPAGARNPIYAFLKSVSQAGYRRRPAGGYERRAVPPVEFEYSEPVVRDTIEEIDAESLRNLPAGLAAGSSQWIDLHGEGIPGLLTEQADTWFYKRNISPIPDRQPDGGDGLRTKFAALETVARKPNVALRRGAQLMDLAGDGLPDVVVMDGPVAGLHEHDEADGWQTFRAFTARLDRDLLDPNVRLIDLDGDGRADVLISEDDGFVWHAAMAEQGFAAGRRVAWPADEERGPRVVFADAVQSIYLADLSGDGLTDIVRIRNGEVCYWPNVGFGRFGAKVTMDRAPRFDDPEHFDPRRLRLADIDGSGTTDIIYLHRDGARLYFNQSGNGWSPPTVVQAFPRIDDLAGVDAIDLLGNGTTCLVWSSALPGDARRPMRYVNLMGRRKPHLLIGTRNHLGAETRIDYAPSTRFYLQDARAGHPWLTRLAFPVHVVDRVQIDDRISRNRFVTRYAYHHGYFDGDEREFRGFGMVETWDAEHIAALADGRPPAENDAAATHVPPVHTKSWFHTGAYQDRERVTRQYEREYFRERGLDVETARPLLLDDTILPAGLTPAEERECCRALKGLMLRREIYADDAEHAGATVEQIERARTPYSIVEQSFVVAALQPRGANRHAVFLTHASEQVVCQYERDSADPRVTHQLTLEVDAFNNVLKQADVGYGRREQVRTVTDAGQVRIVDNPGLADLDPADQARQLTPLLKYSENRVTNAIASADAYRAPLACEAATFELTSYPATGSAGRYRAADLVEPDPARAGRLRHRVAAPDVAYESAAMGVRRRRPIEVRRTLYRSNDLTALLPLGQMESLALSGESYKLAFTPGLLAQVFQRPRPGAAAEALIPDPALILGGQDGSRGGYLRSQVLEADGRFPATDPDDRWWLPSGRPFFSTDPGASAAVELAGARQHFFQPRRYRDPFGQDGVVDFDASDLMPVETRDALGNRVSVDEVDYRVLQPRLVSDPNRNRTEAAFDTLGMLVATAVMGKPSPAPAQGDSLNGFVVDLTAAELDAFAAAPRRPAARPGDSEAAPIAHDLLQGATSRIVYDVDRYRRLGEPPFAATITRETHGSDLTAGAPARLQIGIGYSDGFGREIQKKIQAEPGPLVAGGVPVNPRWVSTGWTVFNNKGKPVRKYEPFFIATHRFEFGLEAGVSPVLFYDPADRVVATVHANHTFEKVVYTPWRQVTYDVNDTCAALLPQTGDPRTDPDIGGHVAAFFLTQPNDWQTWHAQRLGAADAQERNAARRAAGHADTPTIAHLDVLGRTFMTVVRNRVACPDHDLDGTQGRLTTRVDLDIENNLRAVRDERRLLVDRLPTGAPEQRVVMRYAYDMVGNRIYQISMEAGARWTLADAAGNPIRAWDSRGHEFTHSYDVLRRPLEQLVRGTSDASDPRTLDRDVLTGRIEYGEPPTGAAAAREALAQQLNLRTRIFRQFDCAGVATNAKLDAAGDPTEAYDFKGNLLRATRRLIRDYAEVPDWRLDPRLEDEVFESAMRYDALNRTIQSVAPHSTVDRAQRPNKINVMQPVFNDARLLERVDVWLERPGEPAALLDRDAIAPSAVGIAGIDYNARGQRTRIDLRTEDGTAIRTSFVYDRDTFRLTHQYTRRGVDLASGQGVAFTADCENPTIPDTTMAAPEPPPPDRYCGLQSLHYTYDPMGNITHVRDAALQTIYFRNQRVEPDNDYVYDAAYRLIQAAGREHLGQQAPTAPDPFNAFHIGQPQPNVLAAMGTYLERYVYDEAGNVLSMQHRGSDPAHAGWTRASDHAETSLIEDGNGAPLRRSNRLSRSTLDPNGDDPVHTDDYQHDAHGNIVHMPHLGAGGPAPNLHWDYKDRLRQVDLGGGGTAFHVYDAAGQRVRRVWEKPGLIDERIYLGGFEVSRRHGGNVRPIGAATATLERETLHIMDDKQRIALVEARTHDPAHADQAPPRLVRYQIANHLGSAALELDTQAQIVSYEEYSPYGSSTYQAVRSQTETPKRYRFSGRERDEESGLYCCGARFYAPWLARFTQCDPLDVRGGKNLYGYAAANPVLYVDPDGTAPKPAAQPVAAAPEKKQTLDSDAREREMHYKAAAMEAALTTTTVISEHEAQVTETGTGMYYGTTSDFASDPTSDKTGLEECNCILYQMKPIEAYVRDLERSGELPAGTWDEIRLATEDSRGKRLDKKGKEKPKTNVHVGRDTVLMEQLRERVNFSTVLLDRGDMVGKRTLARAVERSGGHYPPSANLVKGADTGKKLDVRTTIDTIFKNTKADKAASLEYLSTLPFAVVTEDYGFHTLVLSYGVVYEAHWGAEPTETDDGVADPMFESTPLADYLATQDNLVFAVPPGYEPPARPGAK